MSANKKKRPAQHRTNIKDMTPNRIVKMVNYLHLSLIIRTLYTCYGWRDKRIKDFLLAYIVLFEEVHDGRNSISGAINDCRELTGIDVVELLNNCTYEEVEARLGHKWTRE